MCDFCKDIGTEVKWLASGDPIQARINQEEVK